ncbi:hypothetical protein [Streptomyces sp. NPDC001880]
MDEQLGRIAGLAPLDERRKAFRLLTAMLRSPTHGAVSAPAPARSRQRTGQGRQRGSQRPQRPGTARDPAGAAAGTGQVQSCRHDHAF